MLNASRSRALPSRSRVEPVCVWLCVCVVEVEVGGDVIDDAEWGGDPASDSLRRRLSCVG